ncbi:MAG: septal ring lytic transglycosylase RlpA family protein [Gammaproteobacteria bacterium]|nr:septal ring lytic transglycosylase RlpA family protein [Gammaproteobacteria bacterium]
MFNIKKLVPFVVALFGLIGCASQTPHQQDGRAHHARHASRISTRDGAPKHPPKINYQRVHPKLEQMSRYGNPDSYRVDGHSYAVMSNAKGYKKRGTASWYGTKFQSKRTSSGESYNMYAMTAAHRTLPIPSYIKVKNLNNGREAIVRVNDRGPFHSSRIVDLSYAAAKYLGLLPRGTASVEVEAVTPKGKSNTHVARYYIQAGAFSSKPYATTLRTKISRMTKTPIRIEPYQHRFIVIVGPFANKQTTAAFKNQLAKQGLAGTFTFLQ